MKTDPDEIEFVTRASVDRAMKSMRSVCSRCGGDWAGVATGRSLWIRPFLGGPGRVAQVSEMYCPKCDPVPTLPQYGEPIYTDELVALDGLTRIHQAGKVTQPRARQEPPDITQEVARVLQSARARTPGLPQPPLTRAQINDYCDSLRDAVGPDRSLWDRIEILRSALLLVMHGITTPRA